MKSLSLHTLKNFVKKYGSINLGFRYSYLKIAKDLYKPTDTFRIYNIIRYYSKIPDIQEETTYSDCVSATLLIDEDTNKLIYKIFIYDGSSYEDGRSMRIYYSIELVHVPSELQEIILRHISYTVSNRLERMEHLLRKRKVLQITNRILINLEKKS